jgi:predicted GIY-YIG superfamily endonuclease
LVGPGIIKIKPILKVLRQSTIAINWFTIIYSHIEEAIAAEKLIKGGSRQSKIDLVDSINPRWKDLYEDLLNE